MGHQVGGFDLQYEHRGSWKVHRRLGGTVIDTVAVSWTKGRREDPKTGEILQEVWIKNDAERQAVSETRKSFVIALATAKDYSVHPHSLSEFVGLFEVVPTGRILSPLSIETRVLARVHA